MVSFIAIPALLVFAFIAARQLGFGENIEAILLIFAFLTLFCYWWGVVGEVETLIAILATSLIFVMRIREGRKE